MRSDTSYPLQYARGRRTKLGQPEGHSIAMTFGQVSGVMPVLAGKTPSSCALAAPPAIQAASSARAVDEGDRPGGRRSLLRLFLAVLAAGRQRLRADHYP